MTDRTTASPVAELPPILEMRNISKTFPGVKALSNVRLSVARGEVHALMGETGAGKSTPDEDPVGRLPGRSRRRDHGCGQAPEATAHRGPRGRVSIIYQELALSPNLTVAENIYLNREPRRGRG